MITPIVGPYKELVPQLNQLIAEMDVYRDFNEGAVPATPSASRVRLYAKADGFLYSKDDAGVESLLSSPALDADLVAIAALAGTSGLLRKTAANTWALDTSIVSSQWITSGSDIYYNTGRVGIGGGSDGATLKVFGFSGQTALHVAGAASNYYIDYLGSGNNYYDGASFNFRTFAGVVGMALNAADGALVLSGGIPSIGSPGNLTLQPGGDLILDPVGNDILPATAYDLNFGSPSKKYLTFHGAELHVETLVAAETITMINGRVVVGRNATILIADVAPADTTIDVKHSGLASGHKIYLEDIGQYEAMAVTSGATAITGGYRYSVTRNTDGSSANQWYAGDSIINTGTIGDGHIEIYASSSIRSPGTQFGPTIVGNVRFDTSHNGWRENWAIGNLAGLYGYGGTNNGVAFGEYAAGRAHITIDETYGYRTFTGLSTVVFQIDNAANIKLGTDISAAATTKLFISNASQTYNSETGFLSGDILIGDNTSASNFGNIRIKPAGSIHVRRGVVDYVTVDSTEMLLTNLLKLKGISSAISIGTTPPTSAILGTGIWLDRTGMYGLASDVLQAKFDSATGAITAGAGNVKLNQDGILFTNGTDPKQQVKFMDAAGSVTNLSGELWVERSGAPPTTSFTMRSRSLDADTTGIADIKVSAQNAWTDKTTILLRKYGHSHATKPDAGIISIFATKGVMIDSGGTTEPSTSTVLELASTVGAFLPPRMTTTQRDALTAADGMVLYNITLATMQYRKAGAWVSI